MLSLQGPKSRQILESICDTDLSNEAFPFSSHQLTTIAGHEVQPAQLIAKILNDKEPSDVITITRDITTSALESGLRGITTQKHTHVMTLSQNDVVSTLNT